MYKRLFLKYANTPLLATNTLVNNAVSLLMSTKSETTQQPKALSTKEGATFEDLYEIRGNIGILNITGPIFRYGKVEACDVVYGTQHFSQILNDFEKNEEIEEVVIQFNTGGGEASGISELSEQINAMTKPTTAYLDGICASAGYWLASPCDKIVANKTALIGSIGVVFAFLDTTKMEEKIGIETIEIVSTVSPSKRVDIKSDDGRAKIQVLADDLADIFVSSIANYRDVTAEYVKDNFGKGDVMIASKALEANMIDEIGTFEALISTIQEGEDQVGKEEKDSQAIGASTTQQTETGVGVTAEEFKASNPIIYQEIFNAGATEERGRIEAIANIDAPHYQAVIREHMFNGTSTVNDVKVALFDARKDVVTQKKLSFESGGNKVSKVLDGVSTTHAETTSQEKVNPLMEDVEKKNKGVR